MLSTDMETQAVFAGLDDDILRVRLVRVSGQATQLRSIWLEECAAKNRVRMLRAATPADEEDAIARIIAEVIEKGGKVLFAAPTSDLESKCHSRFQGLVDFAPWPKVFALEDNLGQRARRTIDEMSDTVLCSNTAPFAKLPLDPTSNPVNFNGTRMVDIQPIVVKIYQGSRVTFTRNHSDIFVKGSSGVVEAMYNDSVVVRSDENRLIMVTPWNLDNVAFFPFRPWVQNRRRPDLKEYDVVLVYDCHKMNGEASEHVLALWDNCDRTFALAYCGDFWNPEEVRDQLAHTPGVTAITPIDQNVLMQQMCKIREPSKGFAEENKEQPCSALSAGASDCTETGSARKLKRRKIEDRR